MNKLKEIGNKYYQECEVVMLATKKLIGEASIMQEPDKLYPVRQYGNRNLYFLSNEDIKEGDWCIELGFNRIFQAEKESLTKDYITNCRKIIAATDKSLLKDYSEQTLNGFAILPQPSKEFIHVYIKPYNESKPITKVLVEMEGIGRMKSGGEFTPITYQLKVNSSNEITIKKVKDSYTQQEVDDLLDRNTCQITALMLEKFKGYKSREEVVELLSKHFVQAGSKIGLGQDVTKFTKTWIEENL